MNNYKTIIALAAAGLACSAVNSQATLATSGAGNVAPGTLTGPLSGTYVTSLLNQSLVQFNPPTLPPGSVSDGVENSWVLSGVSSAQGGFGGADLSFVYQVQNLSAANMLNLTFGGYLLGSVDVEEIASATINGITYTGTVASDTASLTGGTLTYQDFNGGVGIPQNAYSYLLVVNTTSTTYALAQGQSQDGVSGAAPILAPVPEPTTVLAGALMLLPLGIGAVRSLRKDRTA
jgi:hypothetical protein